MSGYYPYLNMCYEKGYKESIKLKNINYKNHFGKGLKLGFHTLIPYFLALPQKVCKKVLPHEIGTISLCLHSEISIWNYFIVASKIRTKFYTML